MADAANHLVRTTRVVPPTLQLATLDSHMVLFWPTSAEGFMLEQSSALDAAAVWSPLTNGIVALDDNFVRTNNLTGPAFYRLHLP